MRIFVDTGSLVEMQRAFEYGRERSFYYYGNVSGVTTNPSLLAKEAQTRKGMNLHDYVVEIFSSDFLHGYPVSLQVPGGDEEAIYSQAMRAWENYHDLGAHLLVKLPINPAPDGKKGRLDSLNTAARLDEHEIDFNFTCVETALQAFAAAQVGAWCVSPFAGRIDDYLRTRAGVAFDKFDYFPAEGRGEWGDDGYGNVSGIDLVSQCHTIVGGYDTEVLAASIRNPRQTWEAQQVRADIATVPLQIIEEIGDTPPQEEWIDAIPRLRERKYERIGKHLLHPKTVEGFQKFSQDVDRAPGYRELFE